MRAALGLACLAAGLRTAAAQAGLNAAHGCRNSGASFGRWELAASNRCFGAGGSDLGDDHPADFNLPEAAAAIKLVYLRGGVSCNFASRGVHSKWGCDPGTDAHMGTFIVSAAAPFASSLQRLKKWLQVKKPRGGTPAVGPADVVAPPASRIDHDNLWWRPYDSNWAESDELTFADSAICAPNLLPSGRARSSQRLLLQGRTARQAGSATTSTTSSPSPPPITRSGTARTSTTAASRTTTAPPASTSIIWRSRPRSRSASPRTRRR